MAVAFCLGGRMLTPVSKAQQALAKANTPQETKQVEALASHLLKSGYGEYLMGLIK